jgi:serine/threonine protein kinase
LTRPFGTTTTHEDVENEKLAIARLCAHGNDPNIVEILGYGELRHPNYFFIDMELCDLNLHDYLYGKRPIDDANSTDQSFTNMVFVPTDCEFHLRFQNIFTIMIHINRGLKFSHQHGLVHRDLKPNNGSSVIPRTSS